MRFFSVPFLCLFLSGCSGQTNERIVGGPCEGCEALLEYSHTEINAIDTLPAFETTQPKLHLFGIVYDQDGQPAKDIIIYIYHTNRAGIYEASAGAEGWAKVHGMYRGWVKTDQNGRYDFYTFRPGSYRNTKIPQHIHMTIKEPNTIPYYIDSIEFTDDTYLTSSLIKEKKKRGGSGIVTPYRKKIESIEENERDIYLGLNIPNY